MDRCLIAAVNEILSDVRPPIPHGKCFCATASPAASVIQYHGETFSRCAGYNITNKNANIILPINSDFIGESFLCSSEMLRESIKFLILSKGMDGKGKIITILENHLRLHPSCATHTIAFYEELLLSKHENLDGTTLLNFVLIRLESLILKGKTCVMNGRISRTTGKKKLHDNIFDDPEPKRSKLTDKMEVEEPEPPETADEDPSFAFFLLKFIAEILKHDFYSKCVRDASKCGNCLQRSLAGRIFIEFEGEIILKDDVMMRILEIYRNSDPSQQIIINEILEVIADLCLFLDSGKLTVEDNILEPKIYPRCTIFGQWFCQRVFKRTAIAEMIPVVKTLRPEWLRLYAAFDTLKRNWKSNIPKGLRSIFLIVDAALQKIHVTELSHVLKTLNVTTQRSSNEEISAIQDELMSACRSDDVAILRKLSETGSIDFQLVDQSGCNILHTVSKYGSLECAKLLLELDRKAIDIDLKDAKGVSPLAYASLYSNTGVYQLLLEYGATPLNPADEKFEISSQSYDAIFKKKLNQEISLCVFHLLNAFISTYQLRDLLQRYEEAKKEEKIGQPVEKRNYEFFARELTCYVDIKRIIGRITQIKNVPVYIDVLKPL